MAYTTHMTADIVTAHFPEGSYPIYIGSGLLSDARLLQKHVLSKQVMLISNETVAPLYLSHLTHAFEKMQCDTVILPDGEHYKTLQEVSKIWDALASHRHHRDTTLIALGGGVVGDMTGFAAACYQRGVHFIQIPTTLLAQADASVGGKTAVDHPLGKNLIGAFHQPNTVIMDIDTLNTLPDREYRAGLTEIIKAALVKQQDFFIWLEKHLDAILERDTHTLIQMLRSACQIKCDIVAADEKEHGVRAVLNLGHTFGHAIEQNLGYADWLHGEAVALGILMAVDLSVENTWLSEKERLRIRSVLTRMDMPNRLPSKIKCDTLLAAMESDKKILNNQLRLVLLKGIGHAAVTTGVTKDRLSNLLAHYSQ